MGKQQHKEELEMQKTHHTIELEMLKELNAKNTAKAHEELQRERKHHLQQIELWKARTKTGIIGGYCLADKAYMKESVQSFLLRCSHQDEYHDGQTSRCYPFQKMSVKKVQAIHNPELWQIYQKRKDDMIGNHSKQGVTLRPLSQDSITSFVSALFNESVHTMVLDSDVNEALLFHGCKQSALKSIVKNGFDMGYASSNGGSMYGEGVYFAAQPCKTIQYTETCTERHMIIARVAIGDPAYLTGRYQGKGAKLRDEHDNSKGRFDSNIVDPDKSTTGQRHHEFVIFNDKQAYPEYLITYEMS